MMFIPPLLVPAVIGLVVLVCGYQIWIGRNRAYHSMKAAAVAYALTDDQLLNP